MHPLRRHWPLFGLRVRCGDVELRLPDEPDLAALTRIVIDGVHDPAVMPFSIPWTDAPPDQRARGLLQYQWRCRADWSPNDWKLELAVVRSGAVVGIQAVMAKEFNVRREVSTGSYLGLTHQGKGTGKLMRHAVLHLAFVGLGAQRARSASLADNLASQAVSRALGYAEDGAETFSPRGISVPAVRYLLEAGNWVRSARPPVEIEGLEPCLDLFGIA